MARHWSGLAPAADGFFCTELQADRELDIFAARPIAGVGVFRLVVEVTDARLDGMEAPFLR